MLVNCNRCKIKIERKTSLNFPLGHYTVYLCNSCIIETKIHLDCEICEDRKDCCMDSYCDSCEKVMCPEHLNPCNSCMACCIEHRCEHCNKCDIGRRYRCKGCSNITSHIHQRFPIYGCQSTHKGFNFCCKCVQSLSRLDYCNEANSHCLPHTRCPCGDLFCPNDEVETCPICHQENKLLHDDVGPYRNAKCIAVKRRACCACRFNKNSATVVVGQHILSHTQCQYCEEILCEDMKKENCQVCLRVDAHHLTMLLSKPNCEVCLPTIQKTCCSCENLHYTSEQERKNVLATYLPPILCDLLLEYEAPVFLIQASYFRSCKECGEKLCLDHLCQTNKFYYCAGHYPIQIHRKRQKYVYETK